jgi:hypothetical protein
MKKILAILMMAIMTTFTMACNNTDQILKTANVIYLDIKTIVTDPEVKPVISKSDWEKLAGLERTYLEATLVLKETPSDEGALGLLVYCTDEILTMIDSIENTEKYVQAIAAIRFSVKILKNHMGAS